MRSLKAVLLCGCVLGTLSGCVTTQESETEVPVAVARSYLVDKPADLRRHFMVKLRQGQRNLVLNDMRLGLAAMQRGSDDLAAGLLDEALGGIETVYADNEAAEKARSTFYKEAVKDFKGEPYERAMAYYYRGLLYMRASDYENARASFAGGLLQDAFAEEDQARADIALLSFLQGWASRCAGKPDLAAEDFREFVEMQPGATLPAADHDTIILVETGQGPRKYSDPDPQDQKHRFLKFLRGGSDPVFEVQVPKRGKGKTAAPDYVAAPATLLVDTYRQATTRGGRPVDAILHGKAVFKDNADQVGDVAVGVGAGVMMAGMYNDNRNMAGAGAAILLIGVMAKAAAAAAEPDADTRYWDNLPERVYGLTLDLPAGADVVKVSFGPDQASAPVHRAGACNLVWVREHPADVIAPRAPNSTTPDGMSSPILLPEPDIERAPAEPPVEAES